MLERARAPIGQGSTKYTHISIGKNRVSHKDVNGSSTVYLQNGTEFELEIRNNRQNPVMAKIKMNGRWISTTGLVLHPGQSFYLDRYLDDAVKFKFDTYDVDGSPEAMKAIRDNGSVEVYWYDEVPKRMSLWVQPTTTTIHWDSGRDSRHWDSGQWTVSSGGTSVLNDGISYTSNTILNSSTDFSPSVEQSVMRSAKMNVNNVETGRVGRGSKSDQSFRNVDMTFESYTFQIDRIKILPASHMSVQYVRTYCECGRRNRSKENFCPQCGNRT